MSRISTVRAWTEDLVIPTYLPAPPDRNPMFLEKRVYQGSSGKVYPLPFTDRITETKTDRKWKAVWLENKFLRVMVLPEIGGRIHVAQDKTHGYDFIYRQNVIKPALVGLAGPWISGGIEFNWPQHHRPATFLPVDFQIEAHADGAKTVWCSGHDPLTRMKGLHGVCLHPGRAYLEVKVRACNRTPFVQTFLWWANAAVRVHEGYQSFFPPDVRCVADHARRAMSEYPLGRGFYYGVNYGERGRQMTGEAAGGCPPAAPRSNDLSWYANIPVPTSYMCLGSQGDFFGGYDHVQRAGFVHVADHHIAPGKKQWTWGNHDFGRAWDRHLTDADAHGEFAPYIELMAGVFTDNQPDFSFLQPGETKAWSQFWYPIQKIGPAQHANLDAAVSLRLEQKRFALGVSVTRPFPKAVIRLERRDGSSAAEWDADLAPGRPFVLDSRQAVKPWKTDETTLRVLDQNGGEIIAYSPKRPARGEVPPPATEPPPPARIASNDELYLTGLHLEQYRHATRCPTPYWREALRRDLLDARCNNAMGRWRLQRGEFALAGKHFRRAIERLTRRNPNPYDGEPFYHLGLCLRYQADVLPKPELRNPKPATRDGAAEEAFRISELISAAYAAFSKAAWNQTWASAACHALAELDCRRADWAPALEHLDRSLRLDSDHLRARDLKAVVLRQLGREADAGALLRQTRALDPLDWWARQLVGDAVTCDAQTRLDLAHDLARAGFYADAIGLLSARRTGAARDLPDQSLGTAPLVEYTLGWLHEKLGDATTACACYRRAAQRQPHYCFPARLEEIAILQAAMSANPQDARAPYYLGNLLYDRRRHDEAIALWERSARLDPAYSVVWRNLGIGYFNVRRQPGKARAAYEKAFRAAPGDARLLYERDQLWKRLGVPPRRRLRELEQHPDLVRQRDDLSIELCALYNQTGRPAKARQWLESRRFQPWEGGEGQALGQHVRTHLALGRRALARGEPATARDLFEAALTSPPNLGEAKHLLANQSDIHYWLGVAGEALGDRAAARRHWRAAAMFKGDFQEMKVRAFSEMTYFSARAWGRLGQRRRMRKLLRELLAYAQTLEKSKAKLDYFATSLPTMLLFDDDLQSRQETTALFLQAQAHLGLGAKTTARRLFATVLKRDPNHALAADAGAGLEPAESSS